MSEIAPHAEAIGDPTPEPLHPRPPTPVAPAPKKPGSELRARLLTALILIPSVIYLIVLGGLPYLVAVVVIIVLGQYEIYELLRDKGAHPSMRFGLVAGGALPVVMYLGNEYHATVMITATLLATMVLELRRQRINEAMASISGTFFGIFYVGWLLAHAVVLRNFDASFRHNHGVQAAEQLGLSADSGIFFMVYVLSVVVLCDTGAYFAGRRYGKRKLAPAISPGKSVEGAVGGIIAGIIGGCLAKAFFDTFYPEMSSSLGWGAAVGFGVILVIVGIIGDLIESLLKRDAQVKDAGRLLPGMGGVLDRIDAPLLAIPVMYYLLLFYMVPGVG